MSDSFSVRSINSFSFHELCAPPTKKPEERGESEMYFSARNFVTRRVGNLKDTYEIGKKLGSGGYGEVYACTHKETKIERAVKIMRRSTHSVVNANVNKEFDILKELDHPNILRQIEMFSDEDCFYIVTEICRGGELLEEIQTWGNFIEEDAAELMRHLLGGVNYCHKQGVAHRDLKPENILLEENKDLNSIKIIDFGLAQCVSKDTVMHDMAGSIYYIAPEVLEGSHTLKADIWSCGVIAFVLLAGYAPFDGTSDEEIKEEILSGEYDFDDEVWDTVSDQAKDFIATMLEYDEGERPTAEEALQHPWIVEGRMAAAERLKMRQSVNQRAMEALYNLERFNVQSKLKQATCAFIASQLVLKEEYQNIDELFRALDINSNGKLTKEDVCTGYKEVFGKELQKESVEQMFQRIDSGNTGYIEYSEFVIATMNEKDLLSNQKLKHAFDVFDVDGSGSISKEELVEVLSFFQEFDKSLDDDVITRIIKQVDGDDDGEIDFDEFVAMMLKTAEDACEKSQLNTTGMDLQMMGDSAATLDSVPEESGLADHPTKAQTATPAKKGALDHMQSALSSVQSIPSKSLDSMKSLSSSSAEALSSAISSVKSFASVGLTATKKDSITSVGSIKKGSVRKSKRYSGRGSVKACLALFERTSSDDSEAMARESELVTSNFLRKSQLPRLSVRLSFAKIQKRDSQEVVRKESWRQSNHSLKSSLTSSSSHHKAKTTQARAEKYEELMQQNAVTAPS